MASESKKYTPRQEFTHLVVAALDKHRHFDIIPGGIKCTGCPWESMTSNRFRQFRKHQAWAVAEEFGWED